MKTVLVVDDEYQIVDVLAMGLEDAGYRVLRASDGYRALELAQQQVPDLLITDFMMPTMNGMELAQSLRACQAFTALPIILITGAHGHIAQGHEELFDEVLNKPFNLLELIDRVSELLA